MHDHTLVRRTASTVALILLWAIPTYVTADPLERDGMSWSLERHSASIKAAAPATKAAVALALDDGSREVDIGFTAAAAFQFLWFNRFDPPAAAGEIFELNEIQVLFPVGPEIVPGAAIQLVVFTDPDGDPTTGANLVAAFDDVIQVVDGTTFSVYPVDPPVPVPENSGDLLVGVVNRFVTSGISPTSRPAALDSTTSAGRSWVALWTGDPPDPPMLPSDDVLETIDSIEPGNWMIRAAGELVVVPAVPALDALGLAALAALLGLAGMVWIRVR